MPRAIELTLDRDDAEILIDALEADLEDYLEAVDAARGEGDGEQADTFAEAAGRVEGLLGRVRGLLAATGGGDDETPRG